MSDHVERAADTARRERTSMEVCQAHHVTPAPSSAWSLLAALESVLDGMPAHDAAVAEKVLRQEANGPWWEDPSDDDDWTNGYRAAMRAILSKADHIKKNGIRNE